MTKFVTTVGAAALARGLGISAAHADDVASNASPPGPRPGAYVTDEPSGLGCYDMQARAHGADHRVQVCN
jgi:hypothetical protein